jgi:hypothetical protein
MIDVELTEQARAVVEERRAAELAAEIAQEAAQLQHRQQMAATGAAMIASQERIRAAKVAAHATAVLEARRTKDALAVLTAERERCEATVGRSRADLEAAQKSANRCTPPSLDDFPLPSELDAHRQRRAELDREAARIAARIGTEQANLDASKFAEWEGVDVHERARQIELAARNQL